MKAEDIQSIKNFCTNEAERSGSGKAPRMTRATKQDSVVIPFPALHDRLLYLQQTEIHETMQHHC